MDDGYVLGPLLAQDNTNNEKKSNTYIRAQSVSGIRDSSTWTEQCFSTFVRPRPGKFFFYKTRARSQQIYSK
jgi:hypothetical protein